jgi:hypothetical protein
VIDGPNRREFATTSCRCLEDLFPNIKGISIQILIPKPIRECLNCNVTAGTTGTTGKCEGEREREREKMVYLFVILLLAN